MECLIKKHFGKILAFNYSCNSLGVSTQRLGAEMFKPVKNWLLRHPLFHAGVVCVLAATFYLYEFLLQVSPSVMTHQLMSDFGLNAATLGVLVAFYYYAYAPMQVPAGILYDRLGPRFVMTMAILFCAIGALFFSLTDHYFTAAAARFLIGIGSAFSFSGALVLISRWFPPRYFALCVGLVELMSCVGAIAGQIPLSAIVARLGWRAGIHWLGVVGTILAVLVWLVIRDYPPQRLVNNHEIPSEYRFRDLLKSKQIWLIGVYSFAVWGPVVAFAALWGVPFLMSVCDVSAGKAASIIAFIWVGIGVGSPSIAWWSEKIRNRRIPLTTVAVLGILALIVIIYVNPNSIVILAISMFFLGIAGSGQSLAFALTNDITPRHLVGSAVGFINMAVVSGGAIFQPLIGILLHIFWHGTLKNNTPFYSASNYHWALTVLPLCYVLAAIVAHKFLQESYCRHQY